MVRNYYWSQALKVQNLVIRWPRAGIYKNSHRDLSFWVARQSVDSTMVHPRSSPERKPDLWRQKWHHGESWLFVACFFTKKVKKVEVEAFWAPRLSKLQHPLPPHAHAHTHTHTHVPWQSSRSHKPPLALKQGKKTTQSPLWANNEISRIQDFLFVIPPLLFLSSLEYPVSILLILSAIKFKMS